MNRAPEDTLDREYHDLLEIGLEETQQAVSLHRADSAGGSLATTPESTTFRSLSKRLENSPLSDGEPPDLVLEHMAKPIKTGVARKTASSGSAGVHRPTTQPNPIQGQPRKERNPENGTNTTLKLADSLPDTTPKDQRRKAETGQPDDSSGTASVKKTGVTRILPPGDGQSQTTTKKQSGKPSANSTTKDISTNDNAPKKGTLKVKVHVSAVAASSSEPSFAQAAKTNTNTKVPVTTPKNHTSQGPTSSQQQRPQPMGNQVSTSSGTLESVSMEVRSTSKLGASSTITKKLTPKSTTRGKRKAVSNMVDPPRMKQLNGKRFKGPDGEFSWSVESSPTRSPGPESRSQQPTPQPPRSPIPTKPRGRRKPQPVPGRKPGRPKRLVPAPPTDTVSNDNKEEDHTMKDETTGSKTTPKTQSQIPQDAVYINLDTDEEVDALVISQERIAEPNPTCSDDLVGDSKSIQELQENPTHHIEEENTHANGEHDLGDVQPYVPGSRPPMADYRSFRPALAKSKMAERYRHLGEEKVFDEISIDWPSNTKVIDELLNQELDFNPQYQAWWDANKLPDLQQKSRDAKRNYFGSDYLTRILDFDLPTDQLDMEIERLEITCFALFQEAGAYIVEETYKTRGFPYEGPVRGILDTYLLMAKQSMTRLQKLLFLFDKICFVEEVDEDDEVDQETSGSDKISFMDWYVSRKPEHFSGYKGVLSDSAIYDLVELHNAIMTRWESGGELPSPPLPTVPAQSISAQPHAPTAQPPNSLIPQPPTVTTMTQPIPFTPPILPAMERVAARKEAEIQSQRRAAASESTVKVALEESLKPAQKTSARSAIKQKHNLLASLTSEANHIRESKMIPRFQTENILKAQASQLTLIEKRLITLDQKRSDKMREFVELTARINDELKATADLTIKFQTTTQQAEEAMKTAMPSFTKSEQLHCRKQFTAGDDLIRSEFLNLTKRRKTLMGELAQQESACMTDFEKIDSERKTLYAQLDRLTGETATGAGISVPEQFLQFAEELRRWGYGKDQKLPMKRVVPMEEEEQFEGDYTPMDQDQDQDTPATTIVEDEDVEMMDLESDGQEKGPEKRNRWRKRRAGPEVEKKVTRAEMRRTRSGMEEIEASRENTSDEGEGWME